MLHTLTQELINEYTFNGLIPLKYNIIDNSTIQCQNEINNNFNEPMFNQYLLDAKNKKQNYYGMTDEWLYQCLEKYPVKDKTVCIFGSANPWYEAILIEFGATQCIVVEYSKRISFNEKIKYITPNELCKDTYDVGVSISSFEHDGLGRYGDPIDPNGDLKTMLQCKNIITKNGLLILSVPIGLDTICYNVHRIYGEIRFPYLIDKWEPVETFGFFEDSFKSNINGINGTSYQPIIVLKNV